MCARMRRFFQNTQWVRGEKRGKGQRMCYCVHKLQLKCCGKAIITHDNSRQESCGHGLTADSCLSLLLPHRLWHATIQHACHFLPWTACLIATWPQSQSRWRCWHILFSHWITSVFQFSIVPTQKHKLHKFIIATLLPAASRVPCLLVNGSL